MSYTILIGDAREQLRVLADQSVQTCVTSPPYYGLRDYNVPGQIGLEASVEEYVAALVEVFREVKRVLRDDGTAWINLGDSYVNGGGNGTQGQNGQRASRTFTAEGMAKRGIADGLPAKNLIGVPWRVAFALQDDGWILRQDNIWHKLNPMPESVQDRTTRSHEYVFHFSKSARYYYDAPAIAEPNSESTLKAHDGRRTGATGSAPDRNDSVPGFKGRMHCGHNPAGRNKRSVWTVATTPFTGWTKASRPRLVPWDAVSGDTTRIPSADCPVHASWDRRHSTPADGVRVDDDRSRIVDNGGHLVLVPVSDSSSTHLSRDAGTALGSSGLLPPFYAQTASGHSTESRRTGDPSASRDTHDVQTPPHTAYTELSHAGPEPGDSGTPGSSETPVRSRDTETCSCSYYSVSTESISHFATFPPKLIEPCILAGSREGDTVLDPFAGSGTTGAVAERHGRHAVLIELNPEYVTLIRKKLAQRPLWDALAIAD